MDYKYYKYLFKGSLFKEYQAIGECYGRGSLFMDYKNYEIFKGSLFKEYQAIGECYGRGSLFMDCRNYEIIENIK